MKPPTFFKTGDFLIPFQEIVNTYGIPSYKEVNPGVFTVVTFPFLFGVMFGDVGHGGLLLLLGLFLMATHKPKDKSGGLLATLAPARYLFTLLGAYALYCGLIYNDFMSIPLELFGKSCYTQVGQTVTQDCIYSFGLDPRWYGTPNELTFMNSLKMKTSVIFGVI